MSAAGGSMRTRTLATRRRVTRSDASTLPFRTVFTFLLFFLSMVSTSGQWPVAFARDRAGTPVTETLAVCEDSFTKPHSARGTSALFGSQGVAVRNVNGGPSGYRDLLGYVS